MKERTRFEIMKERNKENEERKRSKRRVKDIVSGVSKEIDLGETEILSVGREELKADDIVKDELRKVESQFGRIVAPWHNVFAQDLKGKKEILLFD